MARSNGLARSLTRPTSPGEASMPLFVRSVPAVLLVLALGACDDGPAAPGVGDFAIVTNRSVYVARPLENEGPDAVTFRVVATYHNTTDARLWLVPCEDPSEGPVWSIEQADGAGDSGYSTIWGCGETAEYIGVDAGEARTDTFEVRGPTTWSEQEGHGALTGWFRLWYDVSACAVGESCDPVPEHLTRSARFFIAAAIE